ncbi:hypothetical protein HYPSUDRAFT_142675, partial [Hypholoma sublateritium FD-334 SS-4]
HGFPLCNPIVALKEGSTYLDKGVSIGDVGFISPGGSFRFFFNIFKAVDDPIHAGLTPTEFKPIEPPLEDSEITFIPDYFKPGTIIASEGIKVVKHSSEPLDTSFYSRKREGGILILPHGASRQDMADTDRLYEYVQRNAPHWYQVINEYSDYAFHPNGSLVIVTGCDKATDYANASFSNTEESPHRISLRYTRKPNYDLPWTRHDHADVHWFQPYKDDVISASPNKCVFVRTLRVSLSSISWAKALPHTSRFVSFIVQERSLFQRCRDIVAAWRKTRYREKELLAKIYADNKVRDGIPYCRDCMINVNNYG